MQNSTDQNLNPKPSTLKSKSDANFYKFLEICIDRGVVWMGAGLGPGPGPWPPGQALGLIAFALWGGWDQAPGPPKVDTTIASKKKGAKHHVCSQVWAWDLALGLGPLARPWAS